MNVKFNYYAVVVCGQKMGVFYAHSESDALACFARHVGFNSLADAITASGAERTDFTVAIES